MLSHNRPSSQQITSEAKEELLAELQSNMKARIHRLALPEADRKALGNCYEAYFQARCDGDTIRENALQKNIQAFEKPNRQSAKSVEERATRSVTISGDQKGFEAPNFSSNSEPNWQWESGSQIQRRGGANQTNNPVRSALTPSSTIIS